MTVIVLTFLLMWSVAAFWRAKPRLGRALVTATFLFVMAIATGVFPSILLGRTQIDASLDTISWKARNSIVVLGAGTLPASGGQTPRVPFFGYSRVATGAQAYFACRERGADCKVIVSGGDPQRHGATEAAVYSKALEALQVPASDIVQEGRSRNTWQNAEYSTALVPDDRQLVIVASGFQLKRGLLYFSHFRAGVKGLSSDALSADVSLLPSAMNILVTDVLLHEQVGIVRYHVYNALGWNAPRKR